MLSDACNLSSSGSAAPPAYHSQNSNAARPAGGSDNGKQQDGNGKDNGKAKGMPKGKGVKVKSKDNGKIAPAKAKACVKAWHKQGQRQKHGNRKDSKGKDGKGNASSTTIDLGGAATPVSEDSSAARPADDSHNGKGDDKTALEKISIKDAPPTDSCKSDAAAPVSAATSLCLFGRLQGQRQKHGNRKDSKGKDGKGNASSTTIDLGGAATPVSEDSSAARPADDSHNGKGDDKTALEKISTKDAPPTDSCKSDAVAPVSAATSLCLFGRLPLDMWRKLVGLLSYSDVAACACSTSHHDTKRLLLGYMRRRCCISTLKRLLAEYGAITTDPGLWHPDYGYLWDAAFWERKEERRHFWKRAIEIIFTYESKFLLEDQPYQRCDTLTQQDYIHSCGVLFASEAFFFEHRQLQRQFRASYGAGYGVLNRADYWFRYRGFQYCLKGLNPDEHTVLDGLLL